MAGLGIGLLCLPFGAIATPIALAAVFSGAFCADVSKKVRDVEPIENLKINVKSYLDNNRYSL